jgi:hypothetical protein
MATSICPSNWDVLVDCTGIVAPELYWMPVSAD